MIMNKKNNVRQNIGTNWCGQGGGGGGLPPYDTSSLSIYNTIPYTTKTPELGEEAGSNLVQSVQAQNPTASQTSRHEIPSTPHVPLGPPRFFLEFEIFLKNESYSETQLTKTLYLWKTVKSILSDISVGPLIIPRSPALFYKGLAKRKIALGSSGKLIRLANSYLGFYAEQLKSYPPAPIPPLRGKARQYVMESYDQAGKPRPCLPLTPEKLYEIEGQLSRKRWAYLHITLFLGLRPSELDNTSNLKLVTINGIEMLQVFQAKLANTIDKTKCYKLIPILEPEQGVSIRFLFGDPSSGCEASFKKPDGRTIQKYLGNGFGLYSGRKGFSSVMLAKGWKFQMISKALGHSSIQMTESHYTDQENLMISMVKEHQK